MKLRQVTPRDPGADGVCEEERETGILGLSVVNRAFRRPPPGPSGNALTLGAVWGALLGFEGWNEDGEQPHAVVGRVFVGRVQGN